MSRLTRDRSLPARCSFCRAELPRPQEMTGHPWYEFDGGVCVCGATFAVDPTARNGGAVLMQALVMACRDDWDHAQELTPGEDYLEGFIQHYNSYAHRVERNAFGTIYCIRRLAGKNDVGVRG